MNIDKTLSKLYQKYGENPGTMLLHTGTAGWILSCAAQVFAILVNDKIPPEQKTFLIPQELADGAVNILSFYVLTSSVKNLASKAVLNGKIANKSIRNYLQKNKLTDKVGKIDFDIKKTANYSEIKDEFTSFKNGVDVIASTAGSVLSCNIVTPIIRNDYATKQQRVANEYLANKKENKPNTPNTPYHRYSMQTFMNNGGIKVGF